jgi:DNA-binding MarR family transcriptional regulator
VSADDARDLAWLELYQASALLRGELSRRLEAGADMTVLEQDVLWYLSNAVDRRLTMSELAGRLLLSRSGATRLVDRLERRGWLHRETLPENRRVTYAVLTPDGAAAMRRAFNIVRTGRQELFGDRLTPTDIADLRRILGKLLRRLDVVD